MSVLTLSHRQLLRIIPVTTVSHPHSSSPAPGPGTAGISVIHTQVGQRAESRFPCRGTEGIHVRLGQ